LEKIRVQEKNTAMEIGITSSFLPAYLCIQILVSRLYEASRKQN